MTPESRIGNWPDTFSVPPIHLPGEYTGRTAHVLPSPAEDGSYGTNGDAIFGFTPDDVYIEHNMQYMCSTAPLNFSSPVNNLGQINVDDLEALKVLMDKLR